MSKGDKPVTYEEAHAPHYIAHRKGWLSLHTGEGTMLVSAAGAGRTCSGAGVTPPVFTEGALSRDCLVNTK